MLVSSTTNETKTALKRAEEIINELTLEEKLNYIGGDGLMSIKPMKKFGVPEIIMSNGPMGCQSFDKPAAAFPGGIALASTWNIELANKVGSAIGRESRARGVHILLAPGVNICRSPLCGRSFEYLGEDPYLVSQMAVEFIKGVQSQGVLATVKHFACNNQEWNRHTICSQVDERTLHEIYLPAFKAAIQQGGAKCLMTAYNLLNGVYCSQNEYIIKQILREDWGFDGIVMSDWTSCFDAVAQANAGLDLEMPDGQHMNPANLIPAINKGEVSESTIDDKLRHILTTIIEAGFLDRPQEDLSIPKDDPESAKIALEAARESLVLLKNENNLLPLNKDKVKTIVVMGPNAHPAVYCGGGSACTNAFHSVSILDGLRKISGKNVDIKFPQENIGFDGPVKMEIFANRNLEGKPVKTVDVDSIDLRMGGSPADGAKIYEYSVRWSAKITPGVRGKYVISMVGDDGIRVYLDGKLIVDEWHENPTRTVEMAVDLEARSYDVRMEYYQAGRDAVVGFHWWPYFDERNIVKDADAVVFCGGFDAGIECEGNDRLFGLPDGQIRAIKAISEVNRNVIVVLNSAGSLSWDGWLESVPAVLEAWYSGQEIGTAVAEVLFGKVSPSGKLPVTFEEKLEDNPSFPYYNVNDNGKTPYGEGIFVGYRGYDKNGTKPQFPFGYGLSYTTFEFKNLSIQQHGGGDFREFNIFCDVTNTGKTAGAEVVQLYVGDPKCSVQRPLKELKGFCKVLLAPGETKRVEFAIAKDSFEFYDIDSHMWIVEPGEFEVRIGSSSRDLPLIGIIHW